MSRVWAPVAGGLVAAMVATTLAARHADPTAVSPVSPRGAWGPVWAWGLAGALLLYGTAVLVIRERQRLLPVLAIAVAVQAVPIAAPLLLSKDVYLYWSQARTLLVHGGNPYADPPNRYPADVSFSYTSESWRSQTTDYKPLWELTSVVPARFGGDSARRAELSYRVVALLGVLLAIGLVARTTRNARAVSFVGWNPLLALHFAGGGHNDAWLAVLLALAAFGAGTAGGGGAWAAATFFKGFPGLLLPLELARARLRPKRPFWLGLAASTTALIILSFGIFGTDWITSAFSGANTPSGLGGVHWLQELGLRYRYAVVLTGLAFACLYLLLLVHAWRRGRARLSLATSALCLTAAQLRPWYALWPVVLAGAEEDAVAAVVAYALTAYLLLGDAVPI